MLEVCTREAQDVMEGSVINEVMCEVDAFELREPG